MIEVTSLSRLIRASSWRLSVLHGAPNPRLIWITHGQGRVLHGPRLRGTGVHNFIYIPARVPFSLDPGPGLNGHLVTLPEDPAGMWPHTPLLLRVREASVQSEISGLFEALLREQTNKRALYEDAMEAHMRLISIWLSRQLDLPEAVPERTTSADRLTEAFLMDVELNYSGGETMATYARRLGVTPTHLTRVCKAQLGLSASDLIAQRTLYAARDLLETSNHPAKAIAAALGFGAAATFTRFVQAQTGQNPMALRKAARKLASG